MQFVGNKDDIYGSILPATTLYPELSIAEFQRVFHFLSNETEAGILHHARVARITVNQELLDTVKPFNGLAGLSLERFDETETGDVLYKQAVFALTANNLVENQLSMNATVEATDRQEAIQAKADHCLVQYRQAIDLLLNAKATYRFEIV
ncbi:head completion/stabilization protein [Moritella sp. F3]|uniref:head completion/stabilization protein n=1 Tax=Moritella sp. F3 TaxID=2718882 RepID=UPI0018E0F1EF|nr:head completion/stabilization protein [Moritella sp. F3]GIC79500.1 hypothetical protein FMO001_42270 [Moritella sp. F1]GIC79778.1 hypothetical protein FMO003_00590 [Moritella sp. F3]